MPEPAQADADYGCDFFLIFNFFFVPTVVIINLAVREESTMFSEVFL